MWLSLPFNIKHWLKAESCERTNIDVFLCVRSKLDKPKRIRYEFYKLPPPHFRQLPFKQKLVEISVPSGFISIKTELSLAEFLITNSLSPRAFLPPLLSLPSRFQSTRHLANKNKLRFYDLTSRATSKELFLLRLPSPTRNWEHGRRISIASRILTKNFNCSRAVHCRGKAKVVNVTQRRLLVTQQRTGNRRSTTITRSVLQVAWAKPSSQPLL